MDEVYKTLNDNVTTHNKKFYFYLINCEFVMEFDNIFTAIVETNYFYNIDITNIKRCLLYDNYYFSSRVYKVCNINQLTIKTISDRCNMTYEHYMIQPMQSVKLRRHMVVAKNPQLINSLDRDKNHPLIRKYSHIPFTD